MGRAGGTMKEQCFVHYKRIHIYCYILAVHRHLIIACSDLDECEFVHFAIYAWIIVLIGDW